MTTSFTWDPQLYRRFDDHRSRPFFDLLARVGAAAPGRVVDAGCGPGHLTTALAERWPDADVVGFDSSASMLADAPAGTGVRFETGDVTTWDSTGADVVVANAVLQWVDDAEAVLARWAADRPADGWLAVQVPMNFDAPSHVLMREVAAAYPATAGALRSPRQVFDAATATGVLLDAGLTADVWETTYLHVLDGEDPVLRWVSGTGLRPVLAALAGDDLEAFTADYSARLREAYPRRADGTTILPFRRLFVVGHRA